MVYINPVIKILFTVMCLCSFFVLGCDESKNIRVNTENNTDDLKTEEEAVQATLIDMWYAIEKADISKYSEYIHQDFTQFGETDSTLNIGKEMEIRGVEDWIQNSENIHTEMEEPRVTIKGDVAWITYYWKDHGITNGESFSSRGKSTRIFVKEEGKWLCIHGHYTLL